MSEELGAQGFLEKLRPGDVIVTSQRGINPGSWPIRFANFSRHGYRKRIWTHAAIYIGEGQVVEAFPSGITRRGLREAYLDQPFDIVCLRRKGLAGTQDFNKAVEFSKGKIKSQYDFKALSYYVILDLLPSIFHFLLNTQWFNDLVNDKNTFYCSELVATAYLEQDVYCFDRKPSQVMPVDFYNKFCFEVIASNCDLTKKDPWYKKVLFGAGYVVGIILWYAITAIATFFIVTILVRAWEVLTRKSKTKNEKEDINGK